MKTINKLAALLLLTITAEAANFPTGTYFVKGTLKDWRNKVLTSTSEVTVQAVSTNGTVLASAKVADPTADGYNFLLEIPLSSKATDYTAAFGDKLNCVLVQESGLSLALEPIEVGEADTVSTVCLAFMNTQSFTSTNDGDDPPPLDPARRGGLQVHAPRRPQRLERPLAHRHPRLGHRRRPRQGDEPHRIRRQGHPARRPRLRKERKLIRLFPHANPTTNP